MNKQEWFVAHSPAKGKRNKEPRSGDEGHGQSARLEKEYKRSSYYV
jgi:hypothetical protein